MGGRSTTHSQSETISVECTKCGRTLQGDVNRVLDIGRQNIVCGECSRTQEQTTQQANSAASSVFEKSVAYLRGVGGILVQIIGVVIVIGGAAGIVGALFPSLMGKDVVYLMGIVGGGYILYLGHTEDSWLAAAVGLMLTVRAIGGFLSAVTGA